MTWQERAACRGTDPTLFFPTTKGVPTEAAALCAVCRVRAECAAEAEQVATAGVWAGRRLDDDPRSDGVRGRKAS